MIQIDPPARLLILGMCWFIENAVAPVKHAAAFSFSVLHISRLHPLLAPQLDYGSANPRRTRSLSGMSGMPL